MRQSGAKRRPHPTAPLLSPLPTGNRNGGSGRLSPHRPLVPGPVAFARRTSTPATGTEDGVPGRAAAVAPVGGGSVAPAPAAAAAEDAAPRGDAGGAAAGGRTGAEVRDGALSGTVGR